MGTEPHCSKRVCFDRDLSNAFQRCYFDISVVTRFHLRPSKLVLSGYCYSSGWRAQPGRFDKLSWSGNQWKGRTTLAIDKERAMTRIAN